MDDGTVSRSYVRLVKGEPPRDSDALAELKEACRDRRYSDEYIGNLARSIFGRQPEADDA